MANGGSTNGDIRNTLVYTNGLDKTGGAQGGSSGDSGVFTLGHQATAGSSPTDSSQLTGSGEHPTYGVPHR
jgi:hypothetical protein